MPLPNPLDRRGYTSAEIKTICKARKISAKKFNNAFGVNTCAYDVKTKTVYYYPCDVEKALFELGQKDGVNHAWD